MPGAATKKQEYMERLSGLLQEYNTVLICGADMVTSNQMQKIRIALRGKAVLLMGKNTLRRKAIREVAQENSKLERLLPYIKTNIGMIFTSERPALVREVLHSQRLAAPAREGVIAPCDVIVPKGQTTLAPTETSFLQQLGFSSKINKGAIEILNDHHVIKVGEKVTPSQVLVLKKLEINPFSYGLEIQSIYDDGMVYTPAVLDITEEQLATSFSTGVGMIAALGLGIGYPTIASIPHAFLDGVKNIFALAIETDYDLPAAAKVKEMVANPEKFAAAAAAVVAAAPAAGKGAPAAAAKVEEAEEEDDDMGFGLFD